MKSVNCYIALIISVILISCKGMVNDNVWVVSSPDSSIHTRIELVDGKLYYSIISDGIQVMDTSALGVVRSDTDLSRDLTFLEKTELKEFSEHISFQTGKQLELEVQGNHQILTFQNPQHKRLQLEIRIFNDGIASRYVFPEESHQPVTLQKDLTEFNIPQNSHAWLQPYDRVTVYSPAYEWYFTNGEPVGAVGEFDNGWCFPALFNVNNHWLLLSEGGIDGNYAGTHLDNQNDSSLYTIRWPEASEAKNLGAAMPSGKLPWQTSWKTIAIGDLNTIVKSNLVRLVSPPSRIEDIQWIKPGRVSWSWLSDHPSPRNYQTLKAFVDLAGNMGWEYSLIDANWDQLEGGSIEQLIQYAGRKGVGILMWYNSGGPHNEVTEAPRNLMNQRSTRRQEFQRLHEMGVKGVKIDFFQSDKQNLMELYREILEDASDYQIMVNLHGCAIPRGWSRTYPNLITMEAVRGGECYSFDKSYADKAPELNTILPFTRNVIGSMDYTPVIFNHFVVPHITTFAHEIALAVVFESGWLHFGDAVEGYMSLGVEEQNFLKGVPVTWDQVELLEGTPGKDAIIARRKGENWYVGGINGQNLPKQWIIDLSKFGNDLTVTRIVDGPEPDQLLSSIGKETGPLTIEVLPYGGFALKIVPANKLEAGI